MRIIVALLLCAVLLSGCSVWSSTYVQVTPSNGRATGNMEGAVPAENYETILDRLQTIVASGTENAIVYAVNMEQDQLQRYIAAASEYVQTTDPLGAYAVERITSEIGTTGGKMAAALSVHYRHSAMEIRKILRLKDMDEAEKAIREAIENVNPRVVMLIEAYEERDMVQLVQEIARRNPDVVMEEPDVADEVYGSGSARVLELSFSYENGRDSLRQMQSMVQPVFDSAKLYVSGEASDYQKFEQLHAFLMERFSYTYETSITPTYSLLHHGVGDCRAFSTVYAAMCRRAGLECEVITGTRNGQPWTWNLIRDENCNYHVDLLRNADSAAFREMLDADMGGYVWDYSAYPVCDGRELPPRRLPDTSEETTEPLPEETETYPDLGLTDLWNEVFGG